MMKFTKDPSTHPAHGPLTEERLIRVRDELLQKPDYGRDHFFADAVKAIDELLARRAAPVVSDGCPAAIRDLMASHSDALFSDEDAQEIWSACRAAMLAAAPQEVKTFEPGTRCIHTSKWEKRPCRVVAYDGTAVVVRMERGGYKSVPEKSLTPQPAAPQQEDPQIKK